ncbi:SgcJ/EcaC family oxidoreductase [Chroococcidiopsis sp [FACHB-1243]]|uniref:nuclear transport factor 2 family protein n=1 Tax=Chroococcidiopsis sp. [FACHB-1243] TaxID=2692781 RepID=UPI00321FB731
MKVKSYRVALAKLSRRIVILVAVGIFFASIEVFAGIPKQMNVNRSSPVGGKNTSPEQIRTIVRQARDSWVNGDADAFAALFTPDGELIVPGQKWVGRAAIRKAAADFATYASNVKIDIRQIIIEGNRAAVEWYWEDTEKASGRRNRADDAIIADFVAGKIKRWREYIDSKTPENS